MCGYNRENVLDENFVTSNFMFFTALRKVGLDGLCF